MFPKMINIYLFILIVLPIYSDSQQFNFPNQPIFDWQQNKGNKDNLVTFRLIDELVGIFAPPKNVQENDKLIPRMERSEDYKAEQIELDTPITKNENNQHFENFARGVIDLFKSIETTTPTTTTTTTTTQISLLERILPKIFNPFGETTTTTTRTIITNPPLFPFFGRTTTSTSSPQPSFFSFFRKEQPRKKELINEIQQPNQFLIEPVARLFGVERKAVEEGRAQIDTGGSNFDRFVVRQKSESDNPFASIIGGSKWNERGIKWDNGNIRLVDKNGNSLLGTEVGVNDRSVDIPLRRWLEIANGIVNFQQTQQEHVRRF